MLPMRTYGDFVAAAVSHGARPRFGAAPEGERSVAERVITVAAILALAFAASAYAKQT